jgi:hypothetical protein
MNRFAITVIEAGLLLVGLLLLRGRRREGENAEPVPQSN